MRRRACSELWSAALIALAVVAAAWIAGPDEAAWVATLGGGAWVALLPGSRWRRCRPAAE